MKLLWIEYLEIGDKNFAANEFIVELLITTLYNKI